MTQLISVLPRKSSLSFSTSLIPDWYWYRGFFSPEMGQEVRVAAEERKAPFRREVGKSHRELPWINGTAYTTKLGQQS